MRRALEIFSSLFVLWVLLFSAVACVVPGVFSPLRPWITAGLGVIMFGMGMTLAPTDFARVARMPRAVGCGVLGQFLVMPAVGFGLATVAGLSPDLAMGFIIVGSCPGGTASNVVAYLARADVALSVTMTACTTLLAIGATPVLIWLLGGRFLPVDPWAMVQSVLVIVLLPVVAGLGLRAWQGRRVERALAVFPALSVLFIVLIIASIVASARGALLTVAPLVAALVAAHNACGLALGFGLARLMHLPASAQRAVSIEVGMQNSGLGVALATAHFTAQPLVALPASLFSVVHNLTGSALAGWWRGAHGPGDGVQQPD